MGYSRRWQRRTTGVAVAVGLLATGWIALASRGEARSRVEVSSSVVPDVTSTSASDPSTSIPATTTQPSPATTTSTTTTTMPATPPRSDAVTIVGSYVGVEHFALFTGRCPSLDHHFIATFVDSTGENWQFHQDYCGTLHDGDLWDGVGTFGLTASDGAMLSGTVTESDIVVPSPGVPYTIVITAGTQRFAGAAGSCRLDNHLREVEFGVQDQFGSFVCTLNG